MTTILRLDRRRFFVQSGVAGAALLLPRRHAWAVGPSEPVVDTTSGKVRGAAADGINAFKGIPYGASTAGANRFMPPRKPVPWSGLREAIDWPGMRHKPLPVGGDPRCRACPAL